MDHREPEAPNETGARWGAAILLHPLPILAFIAGLAFIQVFRNPEAALLLGVLGYASVVSVMYALAGRRARRHSGALGMPEHQRARLERINDLSRRVSSATQAAPRPVSAALEQVGDEVRTLGAHALRLASAQQRALEHLETADVARVEEERKALRQRLEQHEDPVVRRQLEEALASVERRLQDLHEIALWIERCEAALVNIETTVESLHTRVLKVATAGDAGGPRDTEQLAREIDSLRANALAVEEILQAGTVV